MVYKFRDFYIREQMMEAIDRYINDRLEPGSFLTAVICNDLQGAVGCADNENLKNILAYVGYFYNEAPSECWGSEEKMQAWLKKY